MADVDKSNSTEDSSEGQTVFVEVVGESEGKVWTVEIRRKRPVRNAVDFPTACQLADAFRRFEVSFFLKYPYVFSQYS